MSDVVIKVEDVSKQYRLGNIGTGSLRNDLNRWWHLMRGKEDPYLKIGEVNDRTKKGGSEYVWALRDINFEVKRGEVLGIIGRNGAGKSTLLKILSRTTLPTTGQIKTRGRIASLLEVGTGFHPELTGRENIFLNGAIMGMRKAEIQGKLDEIIDFSGVERYIDTPVKRYSSGMYVRLAFAVAAHLESDILIVDEVLAVGDAEFQNKCLGKMNSISEDSGKTVLFVSHDLNNIRSLCKRGLFLNNGNFVCLDSIIESLNRYKLSNSKLGISKLNFVNYKSERGYLEFRLKKENENGLDLGTNLNLEIICDGFHFHFGEEIGIYLLNDKTVKLGLITFNVSGLTKSLSIETFFLLPGDYSLQFFGHIRYREFTFKIEDRLEFSISAKDFKNQNDLSLIKMHGDIFFKSQVS